MEVSPDIVEADSAVSFIIPALNAERVIRQCLESIKALEFSSADLEIIVVDNGSSDSTSDIARELGAAVFVKPNLSISSLRNFGVEQSAGMYLAFVDSDCILAKQWLSAALPYFTDPNIAAVGCGYSYNYPPSWIENHWYYLCASQPGEASFLPSGNMLIKRSAFLKIGGFNPDLETGEDSDLCLRLRKAGFRIISDSRIENIHLGNPKSLKTFFLKEIWYGKGLKSCVSADSWKDKTFLLTNLFLLGLIISILGLISSRLMGNSWVSWIGSSTVAFVLLGSTVYRTIRRGKLSSFPYLLVLYAAYYLGRSIALVDIYSNMIRKIVKKKAR